MAVECDLVLPCLNEAPALRELLPRVPAEFAPIVVDNGSTDATIDVATQYGARVVRELTQGYGAAVHAGVISASREYVAVMDGDGSFDPAELSALLDEVRSGRATMALGRRRPSADCRWPWHARAGNSLIVWMMRRRGVQIRDIAPMRVCRRDDLLELDVRDRRFGYPFELMRKAIAAGWVFVEREVSYGPRTRGTRSKVSGSVRGSLRVARDLVKVMK